MASSNEERPQWVTSVNKCPAVQVTVYKDGAQVTRKLETVLKKGVQEIIVVDFKNVLGGSMKVSVVSGSGQAAITDVKCECQTHYVPEAPVNNDDDDDDDSDSDLCNEIAALEVDQYDKKGSFIRDEMKLLEQYFEKSASSGHVLDSENNVDSLIQGVQKCMTEYRRLRYALMDDEYRLKLAEKKTDRKISGALAKIQSKRKRMKGKKECVITLDAPEETPIELTISYRVSDAMWVPAYDVHVSTEDGTLKLVLTAMVSQATTEKWEETKLFLTTAEPIIGVYVPELPVVKLTLCDDKPKRNDRGWSMIEPKFHHYYKREEHVIFEEPETEIIDNTTSASYEVPNLVTIPNDNEFHKVTVATVDMTPELFYLTAPRSSPTALLMVKCLNTSPYTFLAGRGSMYLDNSFMSTTPLPTVVTNEEFMCCMGIDSKVIVNYKSLHKTETLSEENGKIGALCEQVTEIKNLHDKDIKVFVRHRLPESSDEKLEVTLVSQSDGSDAFKLVPYGHADNTDKDRDEDAGEVMLMEWDLDIAAGQTGEAVMKYDLKYPAKDTVVGEPNEKDPNYY